MSEIAKLLKARERLVAQREWAIAGSKYYESVQLTSQVGIRDIDQAIAKIQSEKQRGAEIEKSARVNGAKSSPVKSKRSIDAGIPQTRDGFWFQYLDHDGRRLDDVFEAALKDLKGTQKFVPTPDQRAKLRNRLNVAFYNAIQKKEIRSSGKGRDRLYRLPKRKSKSRG